MNPETAVASSAVLGVGMSGGAYIFIICFVAGFGGLFCVIITSIIGCLLRLYKKRKHVNKSADEK